MLHAFKRLYRFKSIYGYRRAFIKAFGRMRLSLPMYFFINPLSLFYRNTHKNIAIIGCGQFAFSTIAYFLVKNLGVKIKYCADIELKKAVTFSKAFNVCSVIDLKEHSLELADVDCVYIASNHATHSQYACQALDAGLDVYVEKPIAVNQVQLSNLILSIKRSNAKIYFGYNRPFSAAVLELKKTVNGSPFSLCCFVVGHLIESDHWYRNPEEGTRVCGNLGHWIDLAVHLLYQSKKYVGSLAISISYSNVGSFDDDICVSFTTEHEDLITLVLTSREEPFEGINETIIFKQKGVFAKIDDFRRAEYQYGEKKVIKKYWPKDVGHERAIMQPHCSEIEPREVEEVLASTHLMLCIMDMVKQRKRHATYEIPARG